MNLNQTSETNAANDIDSNSKKLEYVVTSETDLKSDLLKYKAKSGSIIKLERGGCLPTSNGKCYFLLCCW